MEKIVHYRSDGLATANMPSSKGGIPHHVPHKIWSYPRLDILSRQPKPHRPAQLDLSQIGRGRL